MRVLVDAVPLAESASRGIGTYLREILSGMASTDGLELRALTSAPQTLPAGIEPFVVHRRAPGRFRDLEHTALQSPDLWRAGRGWSPDVVWSPAQCPPLRSGVPVLQTLLDVAPLVRTEGQYDVERRRWKRRAPRFRAAAGIVAISAWTAAEGIRLLGLDADRVTVAQLGVHGRFRPGAPAPAGMPPYLLFVGEYDARKRLDLAVRVVDRLAAAGHPHELLVAGSVAPWFQPAVDELLASVQHPERVRILGYVTVERLVELYQQAAAVLVTSALEGFGLPALEAMACGTPVVAFANSATAEVVEGGGVLVADGDVAAMADALPAVLGPRREELVAAALARAGGFSWARSVEGHVAALAAAAGG